ncbi:MAG: MazG-like family protein [Promethearchaeota archaeon]
MKTPKDDSNTKLLYFKKEVEKFVNERNWTKYHTPKNFTLFENISDEVADIFIYLISLVNRLNINLTDAFARKMIKNRIKYPIEEFNSGNYHKK